MKKSVILAVMAMLLGFTFTSCKEDTQPRLSTPTNFVLNTPPMADQLYVMNANTAINLTVSQPNYGVATTPLYQVEIAKTADGFEKGEYKTLSSTTTSAKITVAGEEFCIAMCELWGYTCNGLFQSNEEAQTYADYSKFAQNKIAWQKGDPKYEDLNVIELKQVKPYLAVKVPDTIQLVGQPEGWSAAYNADWLLYETVPESRVYQGTFEIPEGQFQFRFYDQFDAAEPWDWYSIGAQDADNPVDIAMTDGNYSGDLFYDPATKGAGKGSWQIPNWPGGTVKMTVNLKTKKVDFTLVQ